MTDETDSLEGLYHAKLAEALDMHERAVLEHPELPPHAIVVFVYEGEVRAGPIETMRAFLKEVAPEDSPNLRPFYEGRPDGFWVLVFEGEEVLLRVVNPASSQ